MKFYWADSSDLTHMPQFYSRRVKTHKSSRLWICLPRTHPRTLSLMGNRRLPRKKQSRTYRTHKGAALPLAPSEPPTVGGGGGGDPRHLLMDQEGFNVASRASERAAGPGGKHRCCRPDGPRSFTCHIYTVIYDTCAHLQT